MDDKFGRSTKKDSPEVGIDVLGNRRYMSYDLVMISEMSNMVTETPPKFPDYPS